MHNRHRSPRPTSFDSCTSCSVLHRLRHAVPFTTLHPLGCWVQMAHRLQPSRSPTSMPLSCVGHTEIPLPSGLTAGRGFDSGRLSDGLVWQGCPSEGPAATRSRRLRSQSSSSPRGLDRSAEAEPLPFFKHAPRIADTLDPCPALCSHPPTLHPRQRGHPSPVPA
jgi:hypothetical protein